MLSNYGTNDSVAVFYKESGWNCSRAGPRLLTAHRFRATRSEQETGVYTRLDPGIHTIPVRTNKPIDTNQTDYRVYTGVVTRTCWEKTAAWRSLEGLPSSDRQGLAES